MKWSREDKDGWINRIGVPKEDYEYLETFVKELTLSGGRGYLDAAPWNIDMWGHGMGQRIAEFFSERNLIYLEYNWNANTRRWRIRLPSRTPYSYKTVETALDMVSRMMKSYEECGI